MDWVLAQIGSPIEANLWALLDIEDGAWLVDRVERQPFSDLYRQRSARSSHSDRFDSESCFNALRARRVDRPPAMSSGHPWHSSAATSLAFVAEWRRIRRSIPRADRCRSGVRRSILPGGRLPASTGLSCTLRNPPRSSDRIGLSVRSRRCLGSPANPEPRTKIVAFWPRSTQAARFRA